MSLKERSVYPLSIDPALDALIREAMDRLRLPKAEVMRLAIAVGIESLRSVDFKLAKTIALAARQQAYTEADPKVRPRSD
jgi:hypothetical protein